MNNKTYEENLRLYNCLGDKIEKAKERTEKYIKEVEEWRKILAENMQGKQLEIEFIDEEKIKEEMEEAYRRKDDIEYARLKLLLTR